MAHRVRVRPDGTFRINGCVCSLYNADFDRNEVNMASSATVFASSMNIYSGIVLLVAKLNTLCPTQTSRLYQTYRIESTSVSPTCRLHLVLVIHEISSQTSRPLFFPALSFPTFTTPIPTTSIATNS